MSKDSKEKEKYSIEDLKKAVDSVKNGHLTAYKAEKAFGVPRSTILNHVSGKSKS